MMLQQNSYRNERYVRWLKESHDSTTFDNLFGWVVFLLSLVPQINILSSLLLIGVFSLWNSIRLIRAKYKKPLIVTNRVRRILGTSIILILVIYGLLCAVMPEESMIWGASVYLIFVYCCSSVVIRVANWILKPVERHINNKYYKEAVKILESMPQLKIIGITGSYGKTSTKHFLNRILSEKYDVMMTPGNFNTTLGVVRTIRENLKPYNEIFIVEMGAKQKNDIKEICDLVHPTIGIVTAVGPMHLESFGSIQNVQSTKFELVDSLPSNGLAVVNDDFEYIANRKVENTNCIRYSAREGQQTEYCAKDIVYNANGTTFTICESGEDIIKLHTRLVGECNVSNLISAVVVALNLGVNKEKIRYAVEKIEPVEHRLNLKRLPTGINLIDDAYNSNPVGSKMALDVLSQMKDGKRIVITPGMIELGDNQFELNKDLGNNIAESVDIAIIVGEYNREAILSGLKERGFDEKNVHCVASFNEAQQLMLSIAKRGDTVLYENDLPDTFK